VTGKYDYNNRCLKEYRGIHSPTGNGCEKNWVNIPNSEEFVYSWHPLRIGKVEGDRFHFTKIISTPPLFSHLRGSARPLKVGNNWWTLVHFVEYCIPRKYYHCFVETDENFVPTRISLPFYFRQNAIEFCISTRLVNSEFIDCYPSLNDCHPHRVRISISNLDWISLKPVIPEIIVPQKTGIVRIPENPPFYWHAQHSAFVPNSFIEKFISKINTDRPIILHKNDAFISKEDYPQGYGDCLKNEDYIDNDLEKLGNPIITILATRGIERKNLLYLPYDDDIFEYGMEKILSSIPNPSWEQKKPIVFWRGGASGYDTPSIRTKVVEKLYNCPYADVKLTKWGGWENGKNIPEEYFGDRCGLDKHFQYKYILAVDGSCISATQGWAFGSGSVPIIVTHPKNNFWCKKFMKPMVNYVPVQYDLSDLKENIDWLVANDDKALEIAKNALKFSKIVFSSEFQKNYITFELQRILNKKENIIEFLYEDKCKTRSDINEHLPTLYKYAKKCDTIVDCSIRSIVSSYAFSAALLGNKKGSLTMVDNEKTSNIDSFVEMSNGEGVPIEFLQGKCLETPLKETDLLFIDTWHTYPQLKRELEYWNTSVKKYIIMHDTTVDEFVSESVRCNLDIEKQSRESGFSVEDIRKGIWYAIEEFLQEHSEWKVEERFTNNNGLTILSRISNTI
jgi:hypothetical protein